MKHSSYRIAFLILALSIPLTAQTLPKKARSLSAANTPTATPSPTPASTAAARALPFHGMITEIDQTGKSFTIAGKQKSRMFRISERTVITKSGKTATLGDITENHEVSGSYWKNADGTLEAKTVKLDPVEKAKTSTSSATPTPKTSATPEVAAPPNG